MQAGWYTDTEVGFAWNSAALGGNRPLPFTRVAIFDPVGSLLVVSQPDIFNPSFAWIYPAFSVNQRGHLGATIEIVGSANYPSVIALVRDDFSVPVTSGWEGYIVDAGTDSSNLWGDYNGSAPHEAYATTWLGVGRVQDLGNRIRTFWFGRERDMIQPFSLTISGSGAGSVASTPAGISCSATCSTTFPLDTQVTLVATPQAAFAFAGWSGACSGSVACTVRVTGVTSVQARFEPALLFSNGFE